MKIDTLIHIICKFGDSTTRRTEIDDDQSHMTAHDLEVFIITQLLQTEFCMQMQQLLRCCSALTREAAAAGSWTRKLSAHCPARSSSGATPCPPQSPPAVKSDGLWVKADRHHRPVPQTDRDHRRDRCSRAAVAGRASRSAARGCDTARCVCVIAV